MDARFDLYNGLKDKAVLLETKEADIKLKLVNYKRDAELIELAPSSNMGAVQAMPTGGQTDSLTFEVVEVILKACF